MTAYLGEYKAGAEIHLKFCTVDATGLPTVLTGSPAISVYKANSTTESTAGVTLTASFDSVTGLNHVRITTVTDGTFYAGPADFQVVITAGTVGGVSVVGYVVAQFSLANRVATELGTQAKADVNAEVVDGLNVDTYAEPGQEAPGATVSLAKKLGYLYKAFRNKLTDDGSTVKIFADDATTVDQKATVSKSGGTVTRGEFATGP